MDLLRKALRVLRTRPLKVMGYARQYWLFYRTGLLKRFFLTPEAGIRLGRNVRIQRLRCVSAERPSASVEVGDDCVIYENAQIGAFAKGSVSIGQGSVIGDARIVSRERIRIGSRVVTSWNVFIQDFDPHPVDPDLRRVQMIQMTENFKPAERVPRPVEKLDWAFPSAPIEIGDDVWLGANTTILKGARIGAGSIVATGSVVTAGEYPPRSVLAGMPAKVVKTL
jgi:acetyltransferase-like isoleucine patch superfamily enzyme